MIETTMNPFVNTLLIDTNLYCLADGKKVHDKVKHDILKLFHLGKKWNDEFLDDCLKDSRMFEKHCK